MLQIFIALVYSIMYIVIFLVEPHPTVHRPLGIPTASGSPANLTATIISNSASDWSRKQKYFEHPA